MICYLSFYVPNPLGLGFGYDRCPLTDTDHLSSSLILGRILKMPGVSYITMDDNYFISLYFIVPHK